MPRKREVRLLITGWCAMTLELSRSFCKWDEDVQDRLSYGSKFIFRRSWSFSEVLRSHPQRLLEHDRVWGAERVLPRVEQHIDGGERIG